MIGSALEGCFSRRHDFTMGGSVTKWLVDRSTDRAVHTSILAEVITLSSWAWHFTLTLLLFSQV